MKHTHIQSLPFPSLVNELRDYEPNVWLHPKAGRLYYEAIARGKTELAKNIYIKYKKPTRSDLAISYAMTLQAIDRHLKTNQHE